MIDSIRKRIVTKAWKYILLTFVIVIVTLGIYKIMKTLFTITQIEVLGEGIEMSVNRDAFVNNLIFFPARKLEEELSAQYPLLSDIRVTKKYPHTLMISADVRKPFAHLISTAQSLMVDAEGVVLSPDDGTSAVPTMRFTVREFHIGETITDPFIGTSLVLIRHLNTEKIRMFTRYDESVISMHIDTVEILFPITGDTYGKVATLQSLLVGFRIKGTLPSVIDLRYDKPIIRM